MDNDVIINTKKIRVIGEIEPKHALEAEDTLWVPTSNFTGPFVLGYASKTAPIHILSER